MIIFELLIIIFVPRIRSYWKEIQLWKMCRANKEKKKKKTERAEGVELPDHESIWN